MLAHDRKPNHGDPGSRLPVVQLSISFWGSTGDLALSHPVQHSAQINWV